MRGVLFQTNSCTVYALNGRGTGNPFLPLVINQRRHPYLIAFKQKESDVASWFTCNFLCTNWVEGNIVSTSVCDYQAQGNIFTFFLSLLLLFFLAVLPFLFLQVIGPSVSSGGYNQNDDVVAEHKLPECHVMVLWFA